MKTAEYKYAVVKYNNGEGALLCNECFTILSFGFDHEDKIHICDGCWAYRDHTGHF